MKRAILISLACLAPTFGTALAGQPGTVFTVTAYCHCAKCCGQAGQPAANGKRPVAGMTVAGPRRYRLGTKIHIAGIGDRVINDRLAARYDNRIDLFFANHADAQRFGLKKLTVTILK